jgi:hypothetical protein
MSAVGSLRRNPFWPIITRECFHFGYKDLTTEETRHSLVAVIHGYTSDGVPGTQKYTFPRTFKALESLRNFRSQFRNFLRYELPDRGFFPAPDHRTRRPGCTIAHIDHDVPRKKLVAPKSLQAALCASEPSIYDGLVCAPVIPEEIPSPPARSRSRDPDEPVSDSKVLALFLLEARDLGTLIEVSDGTARFRGSRPAPLRILGERRAEPSVVAPSNVEPPATRSASVSPAPNALPPEDIATRPEPAMAPARIPRGLPLTERIMQRINSDRRRQWRSQDLSDLSRSTNSIGPTLSMLAADKRIVRVSRGVYEAALTQ